MRYLRGSKGTSVIEVIVVMVVLLVGILTVVRLFPPGFASVRRSLSMTMAGRLAQQEMERWENNAANLPEGILPIGGSPLAVLSDQFPGPPIDEDNAGSMRRVIGETTRIPFGGWSTGPESGSVYMLAFAPISVEFDAGGLPTNFVVRGGALNRRIMDSSNTDGPQPWSILSAYQYAIDYDDMKIAFKSVPQERVYWISCSWWEQSGGTAPAYRSDNMIRVVVPANTNKWLTIGTTGTDIILPVTTGSTLMGLDDYSDSVSRGFRYVESFSEDDPYEYQLRNAALGIIAFNPLGFAQKEFGKALEAKIDYDILDLQIIREDKRAGGRESSFGKSGDPATARYRINLTLNQIKQVDVSDVIIGNELKKYTGIYMDPNDPSKNINADVVAVDLETGYEVDLSGAKIDYQNGIIDLPREVSLSSVRGPIPIPVAGRNFRFFYKAENDWSLQFQKAYSQYVRADGTAPLDYRSYCVTGDAGDVMWFSSCNANNTMSVTYEYHDEATDTFYKVVGECYRATDAREDNPNSFTDPSGKTIKWTKITLRHPANTTISRIFSVNGVSARARVIWRDSDRWRHVDLDTTLLRKPAN